MKLRMVNRVMVDVCIINNYPRSDYWGHVCKSIEDFELSID